MSETQTNFSKIKHFLSKLHDLVISDIFFVLPSFAKWLYQFHVKKEITAFPLENSSGKKATLFLHDNKREFKNDENIAVLILHGMHGHPAVMLNFVESVPSHFGPVFNFYVTYDETDLNAHRTLIKQALDYIESFVKEKNGHLKGIVMVGHSMGGIESANTAFIEKDKRIISVVSLAGRLKLLEGEDIGSKSLESSINAIYRAIQLMHDFPLFQIVGDKDWCVPLDSIVERKNKKSIYIVKNGKHLNLLFKKETLSKFHEFLQSLFSTK